MNTAALSSAGQSPARAIAQAVAWRLVVVGFISAFGTGALIALCLKAMGWWPGALWEQNLLHAAQRLVNPALDLVMLVVPLFGTNYSVAPLVAIAVFLLWRKRQYAIALHMAVVQAGSWALNPSLKFAFPRDRPTLYELRGQFAFPAYPSGHSMVVVAVLLTAALLIYRYRGRSWAFWVVGAMFLLNSFSRIYLSVHWATDLIAGSIVGAIWMLCCWHAFRAAHEMAGAARRPSRSDIG